MNVETATEATPTNTKVSTPVHLFSPGSDSALCGASIGQSVDRPIAERHGICPDCVDMVLLEKS